MASWKDARGLAAALFMVGAWAAAPTPRAHADETGDKKAAHDAYERGARAFGQGSYSVAAAEFARADELQPSAAALEAALKAAILAEDPVLAMTLVERAATHPANDGVAAQVARARDRFAEKVARLSIACAAPCSVKVGNEPVPLSVARYYRAGNYVIEVTSGAAAAELFAVQLPGGANMDWRPPARAAVPAESSTPSTTAPVASATPTASAAASAPVSSAAASSSSAPLAPRASRLSPAWFGVGLGVTALAGGVAIGFGVDTLQKHDAFVANRTEAGAASGRDAELRTNVLLGVTAATAIATAILGYVAFRARPASEAHALQLPRVAAWLPTDPRVDPTRSALPAGAAPRAMPPPR